MASSGIWEMNAWKLFLLGGPVMWPILFCSIFSFAIVVEKFIYLGSIKVDAARLRRQVFDMVKNNKIKEAVVHCDAQKSPIAKIFKAALVKFGSSREELKEHIEDVSLYEIPKLESRLSGLATIGHVSPLLGLLGTVTGMVTSFQTIQMRAASMNPVTPGDLAGGIGEALITTVAGLMVAIPTFVFYNYFVSRVNHLILEMERAATEIVNFISQTGQAHS